MNSLEMPTETKNPPSPRSIVKKIEDDHHLLAETKAYSSMRTIKVADRDDDNKSLTMPKPIEPESHLLVPTNSVITGSYRKKEEEEKEAARLAALRLNAPVRISERLLEPTAANIHSRSALEAKTLETKDDADTSDIWWQTRGSPKQDAIDNHVDPYEDKVQAKYLEHHTTAYVAAKTTKYQKPTNPYDPIAMPKPIDPESHVLTHTSSVRNAAYNKEEELSLEPMVSEYRLLSMQTGPKNVESRLHEPTTAVLASKWKPKDKSDKQTTEEGLPDDEASASSPVERKLVRRTSERLLEPTIALEYSKYVKPNEPDRRESGWKPAAGSLKRTPSGNIADEIESQAGPPLKVKEPSARLLEPTIGLEHAKWKGSSSGYVPWTNKERDVEVVISEHLVEPTASNEYGRYVKQENQVDPREVAWKPVNPKVPKDLFDLNDPREFFTCTLSCLLPPSSNPQRLDCIAPAFLNPTEKVVAPSDRLTTPTIATENGKWRGPPDLVMMAATLSGSQDGRSENSSEKKKVSIKPVTSNEHFLTSTAATLHGSVNKPKEEEKPKADVKKVKEPSAHLLQPTANNQFDNWKNQTPKAVPETEEAAEIKRVASVRKVTTNAGFLKPTAATVNGTTTKRSVSVGKDVSVKNLVKKFSSRNIAEEAA
jgi:hypothetical protein